MTNVTQQRLTAIRAMFAEWKVDALWIEDQYNRRWLSGFTGSAGSLLITKTDAYLMTDFRYWAQAESQAPEFTLFKLGEENLTKFVNKLAKKTVGVESNTITLTRYQQLQKYNKVNWRPLHPTLEQFREIKTDAELKLIKAAAHITDLAMESINQFVKPGMSEKEIAWELEKRMRDAGATAMAFDIIVAAGPNAAMAHHRPSDRKVQEGDSIIVDMGAVVDGYHSDMTRSFHLGSQPDENFWEIYNLVLAAQQAALEEIKAGMTGKEADDLARKPIGIAGYGPNFGHSLGHGVGLYIHEGPRLSSASDEPLPNNAVVTVEPGVYITGWGGIRIEDLVLTTKTGIEFLSHCPKNPIIPIN